MIRQQNPEDVLSVVGLADFSSVMAASAAPYAMEQPGYVMLQDSGRTNTAALPVHRFAFGTGSLSVGILLLVLVLSLLGLRKLGRAWPRNDQAAPNR